MNIERFEKGRLHEELLRAGWSLPGGQLGEASSLFPVKIVFSRPFFFRPEIIYNYFAFGGPYFFVLFIHNRYDFFHTHFHFLMPNLSKKEEIQYSW